jgi:hypothetical protein
MKIAIVSAGTFIQNARGDPRSAQENDRRLVTGYWSLAAGLSLFASSQKREASGQKH